MTNCQSVKSTAKPSLFTSRKSCLAVAIAQALLLGATSAHATTITVDSANDPGSTGICTLRDAIQAAQTDTVVNGCVAGSSTASDSIVFASSLTTSPTTITLSGSALSIGADPSGASDLSIDGANNISINAAGASRVMDVNGGNLTLNGLTLKGGYTALIGGGLYAHNGASVSLSNCTISGNSAVEGGGGLVAYTGTTVSLSNSTVSGNSSKTAGGAAALDAVLNLINTTVSGNSATGGQGGGGVLGYYGATVNLTNSTVSGNSTDNNGGGIFVSDQSPGGSTVKSSNLTLSNSTVSGNSAANLGGGILAVDSSVALTNSTVSGNSAAYGGGVIEYGMTYSGSVSLTNSTVSGNTASTVGGVGAIGPTAVLSLSNSIVANSAGGGLDCDLYYSGTVTADAHNIILTDGCSTSAQHMDPMLGALADNGGPTFTLLPQTGSPVIDQGDQAACTSNNITTDQRGYSRSDGSCDIGSVEVGATPPPTSSPITGSGGGGATDPLSLLAVGLLWPLRRWRRRQ